MSGNLLNSEVKANDVAKEKAKAETQLEAVQKEVLKLEEKKRQLFAFLQGVATADAAKEWDAFWEPTVLQERPAKKNICLRLFFLIFGLWTPDLLIFDLKIGFLVKNCIYRPLERSGIPKSDQNMMKFSV